jgi:hypothetical protein
VQPSTISIPDFELSRAESCFRIPQEQVLKSCIVIELHQHRFERLCTHCRNPISDPQLLRAPSRIFLACMICSRRILESGNSPSRSMMTVYTLGARKSGSIQKVAPCRIKNWVRTLALGTSNKFSNGVDNLRRLVGLGKKPSARRKVSGLNFEMS